MKRMSCHSEFISESNHIRRRTKLEILKRVQEDNKCLVFKSCMRMLIIIGLIALIFISFTSNAEAHRLQPAYLEINEQAGGTFSILWKVPYVAGKPMNIYPQLPSNCTNRMEPVVKLLAGGAVGRWIADCGSSGMINEEIVIEGLPATQTDTLLRIQFTDGSMHTTVLRPDAPSFFVPTKPSKSKIAGSYLLLGIEHILGGFDHLLFVLGLLLIVRSTMLLIKTITSFTLAHSVTLAMAALGFVHVPQAPVEAVIALSIIFLATELVKQHRGETGLTTRAPWLVALCFGLLHGFGFAGALTEVGLPQTDIPLALLFFNVGVEIGQLMFVAGVLVVAWLIKKMKVKWPVWVEQVPAYAIGSLAAFWFIQRTMSFW
jgi:hydrogenase/urease accessory protein HupE